jgi:hypothetical protein
MKSALADFIKTFREEAPKKHNSPQGARCLFLEMALPVHPNAVFKENRRIKPDSQAQNIGKE